MKLGLKDCSKLVTFLLQEKNQPHFGLCCFKSEVARISFALSCSHLQQFKKRCNQVKA